MTILQTLYVLGFLFDESRRYVWLIEKARPKWQKGKLNGIGGHIESGETQPEAIRREFREETGLDVPEWSHTVTLTSEKWVVFVYRSFLPTEKFTEVQSLTDEKPVCLRVNQLSCKDIIENSRWLIPMQLDDGIIFPVTIPANLPGE